MLHLAKKGTNTTISKKIPPKQPILSRLRKFRKRKGIDEIEKNLLALKAKDVDLDEIDFTLPWLGLSDQSPKQTQNATQHFQSLVKENIVHEPRVPALKLIEIHTIT